MKYLPIVTIAVAVIATLAGVRAWIFDTGYWTAVWEVALTLTYIVAVMVQRDEKDAWSRYAVITVVYLAIWYMPVLYLCAAVGGAALTLVASMIFFPASTTEKQQA